MRAGGNQNPVYEQTFVFVNDFAALLPETPLDIPTTHSLLRLESQQGACRVICFSPRHDVTLPEMELDEIRQVVEVWVEQILDLGKTYRWVQIFENKGEIMGCSNPHPHGQIWAGSALPNEPAKEHLHQQQYFDETGQALLLDYAALEAEQNIRIVSENAHWLAVVPYWAVWPFELLLMPRRHVLRLPDLTNDERNALAEIMKKCLSKYDNVFQMSFPYSMGWHGAPNDDGAYAHWQLHAHYYPPLLRSATVKKFMVGYEMLGEPQRDITPEQAAQRLREVSDIHYTYF